MTYFPQVWLQSLTDIMNEGNEVAPRGKKTLEVPQRTIVVDMRRPVLKVPARKLSYTFMAAEAYWILTGDDRVETIAPYNKNISQFSDDGVKFFGAYGPKILGQMEHVVKTLSRDPDSRQAGLTIWRENPPETKDVPCTVAIFFSIRDHKLNAHVFMRSSDIWLGVPYDVFNFSMLSHMVCALLNTQWRREEQDALRPGNLYLTAASSHLYDTNWAAASECQYESPLPQAMTPDALFTDPFALLSRLEKLRESRVGDSIRWWERDY